jgi:hypothetical protein
MREINTINIFFVPQGIVVEFRIKNAMQQDLFMLMLNHFNSVII